MKHIHILLLLLLISACSTSKVSVSIKPGIYDCDDPHTDYVESQLEKSNVTIALGATDYISVITENDKKWNRYITFKQLETAVKKVKNREQVTILEEKSYRNNKSLNKEVLALLKKYSYKTVIIQRANSEATVVKAIIKN